MKRKASRRKIRVLAPDGTTRGEHMVHDVDPVFVLPLAAGEKSSDIHLDKGDTIWLAAPRSRGEERLVVGVTIEVAPFVSEHLRIIAPKQVRTPIPDEDRKSVV